MSSVLPYPGFLYAATVCELSNSDVTELNEGCLAYVEVTNSYYRLSDTPIPPVPDGTTVISVPGGPATPGCFPVPVGPTGDTRRWVLTNIADVVPVTANALAWYINAVSGLDTNIGTDPLFPLLTARELGRRWKEGAGYNTGVVSVTIQSDHLLPTDIVDVERPITTAFPVVFYGTRGPDLASGTLTGCQNLDRATNHITKVTAAAFDFSPYVERFIRTTIGGQIFIAFILATEGVGNTTAITTPFTFFPTESNLASAVLSRLGSNPILGTEAFTILGLGCSVPQTIILKTDALSQVIFYDVTVSSTAAPVPYAQQNLDSGILAFARSQADVAHQVAFVADEDATIVFINSSTQHTTIVSDGTVTIADAFADLRAASNIQTVQLLLDTVVADNWSFMTSTDQRTQMENVCINDSTHTKIRVKNGTLFVVGALYGLNNADYVLSLSDYARGYYDCGGVPDQLLGMTIQGIGAVPANMNFQNGPLNVKPMDALNLPFVARATALDSQAGFIRHRDPS